jgi:hypothetical protein
LATYVARRPTLGRAIFAGSVMVIAGFYFLPRIEQFRPHKDHPTEAHKLPAAPRAIAASSEDRSDDSATAPAKTVPRNKSSIAQDDPALDKWFIEAYSRCWTPPANHPPGGDYAAKIRVLHGADGSLAGAPVLVNPPSDPAWRPYADSAVRAVTACNPLAVPPQYLSRFDQWRKMTLYFSSDSLPR